MKRDAHAHPKVLRLMRLLNVSKPAVVGHLHLLWTWVGDYAIDGDITDYLPEAAEAAGWEGDPDEFIDAMVECRLLDRDEDGRVSVHDWLDHCEDYVRKRLQRRRDNGQHRPRASANGGQRRTSSAESEATGDSSPETAIRQRRTTADNGSQSLPAEPEPEPRRAAPKAEPEPDAPPMAGTGDGRGSNSRVRAGPDASGSDSRAGPSGAVVALRELPRDANGDLTLRPGASRQHARITWMSAIAPLFPAGDQKQADADHISGERLFDRLWPPDDGDEATGRNRVIEAMGRIRAARGKQRPMAWLTRIVKDMDTPRNPTDRKDATR